MAYTILELHPLPAARLVTAIYKEDGEHFAVRVLAFAVYRDMEARGGENVLVPICTGDFLVSQSHYFLNRRTLNDRLPVDMVEDGELWEAVAEEGTDSTPVEFDREAGKWVVL